MADQKDTMVWEGYDEETDAGIGVFYTGTWYIPMYYDRERNEYVEEEGKQFSTLDQAKDYIQHKVAKKDPFWFRKLW